MSSEELTAVVRRAISDPGFRDRLITDPAAALAGCDLTDEERATLLTGDPDALQQAGVDVDLIARLGP